MKPASTTWDVISDEPMRSIAVDVPFFGRFFNANRSENRKLMIGKNASSVPYGELLAFLGNCYILLPLLDAALWIWVCLPCIIH